MRCAGAQMGRNNVRKCAGEPAHALIRNKLRAPHVPQRRSLRRGRAVAERGGGVGVVMKKAIAARWRDARDAPSVAPLPLLNACKRLRTTRADPGPKEAYRQRTLLEYKMEEVVFLKARSSNEAVNSLEAIAALVREHECLQQVLTWDYLAALKQFKCANSDHVWNAEVEKVFQLILAILPHRRRAPKAAQGADVPAQNAGAAALESRSPPPPSSPGSPRRSSTRLRAHADDGTAEDELAVAATLAGVPAAAAPVPPSQPLPLPLPQSAPATALSIPQPGALSTIMAPATHDWDAVAAMAALAGSQEASSAVASAAPPQRAAAATVVPASVMPSAVTVVAPPPAAAASTAAAAATVAAATATALPATSTAAPATAPAQPTLPQPQPQPHLPPLIPQTQPEPRVPPPAVPLLPALPNDEAGPPCYLAVPSVPAIVSVAYAADIAMEPDAAGARVCARAACSRPHHPPPRVATQTCCTRVPPSS